MKKGLMTSRNLVKYHVKKSNRYMLNIPSNYVLLSQHFPLTYENKAKLGKSPQLIPTIQRYDQEDTASDCSQLNTDFSLLMLTGR